MTPPQPGAIPAALLTLPIGLELELEGIVDVLRGRALRFEGEHGQDVVESGVPAHLRDAVKAARLQLLEAVAETDEALLERYVAGDHVDEATLRAAIRRACVERRFTPVLCGTARGNIGVQPLLDAVVAYLPHPGEVVTEAFGPDDEPLRLDPSREGPLPMRPMNVPEPVMAYAIVPKDKTVIDKLSTVLGRLHREDPTRKVRQDPQTGGTLLAGMGELHLEVYVDRLRDEHGIELYRSAPQVDYREALQAPIVFDHLHRKQDGGKGQYARVVGSIRPAPSRTVGPTRRTPATSRSASRHATPSPLP